MQIGVLLIVDGAPLVDATGAVRLEEIRHRIDLRLMRVPALRRRLMWPGPLQGRPVWVDDPSFDITRHVRRLAPQSPMEDAQLLAAVERLMSTRLPRGRPLWQLWVTDGLRDGRVGILLKLHHTIADGLAVLAMLASLFDVEAVASDPAASSYRPERAPRPWRLFVDNLSTTMRAAGRGLGAVRHAGATWQAMRTTGAELQHALRGPAAPRTGINRPVLPGRRIRFTHFDLEAVRTIAHAAGGTVNDLVLNLVAGGLRELLLSRGEPVGQPLIASVPVSLRSAADAGALGNAVGTIAVPLDVGEGDARQRLEAIIRATREAKREQHPAHIQAAMGWLAATPLARPFITRQHLVNVFITNVVGPTMPMYFLGARIVEAVPIVSPVGNVALAFCAFSHAGTLVLVTTVDASACPDVDHLITGMQRSWEGLGESNVAAFAAGDAALAGPSAETARGAEVLR